MVKGSIKGGKKERDISHSLSLWVSQGERDDLFWRSSQSGGMFTTRQKKGRKGFESQIGDIQAVDPLGESFIRVCAVEVKHYKDLQLGNILCGKKSKLQEFWDKHSTQCRAHGRIPILIGKENYRPEIILLPSIEEFSCDRLKFGVLTPNFSIYPYDVFLKHVSYERFMSVIGGSIYGWSNGRNFSSDRKISSDR